MKEQTKLTQELLRMAGFALHPNPPYIDYQPVFYKIIKGSECILQVLFRQGEAVMLKILGKDGVMAMQLTFSLRPTMELLSSICFAYTGEYLVWDLIEIWRGQLEEMGFKVVEDITERGRMLKQGKTAKYVFYLYAVENERFVYDTKEFLANQEYCLITGINTPDDVRKFLEAVHEL
jgi:hypothetical protein